MKLVIDLPEEVYRAYKMDVTLGCLNEDQRGYAEWYLTHGLVNGTPLTLNVLADALMEERIRGKLNSDTTFEKDIIPDVKCILTVNIKDRRPCYCGAGLREVWRESEEGKTNES